MIKKIALGLVMTTGMVMGGCSSKPENLKERAILFMSNKPQNELEEVIKPLDFYPKDSYNYAQVQSNLDSVAYKKVFESTQGVKDSVLVSEFNKIASKAKAPVLGETTVKMKNNLLKTRIGQKDYSGIISKFTDLFLKHGEIHGYEYLQFATDSVNYRKFFDKHKLLDEKSLKLLNEVTNKIKP